ncbi:uncharacterized protein PFL1_04676 [Pseudozyma flocculosa PF-1]|uniref:Uncharacterized protein n=1 Tax=Pseudozyma flocculosa PF-1 TaxID=1277687 RepID=A0A061H4T9_9BASI|nr:uncharacterized protein PFL1_04676 [Pseudozyma flocculosa PF-1]EPQ27932.1 hypothetical protein PFL1_04676 [Pseudozyma flocculosa PF-1]
MQSFLAPSSGHCRRPTLLVAVLITMLAALSLSSAPSALAIPATTSHASPQQQAVFADPARDASPASSLGPSTRRVNVTLGVMSRCPDALACEATFDKALDRVNTKVHLEMAYIGTLNSSATYGVDCKHGDSECAANIQQLCLQHALDPKHAPDRWDLSPSAAQRKWWNFIQCQNYAGLARIGSEALAKRCLDLIDGPDWHRDGIERCVNGKLGRRLLRDSVARSKHDGVTTSCTILIEGHVRCIRDGGQWKQCDIGHEAGDFVAAIDKEWQQKNRRSDGQRSLDVDAPVMLEQAALSHPSRLQRRQDPNSTAPPPSATPSNTSTSGSGGGLFGGNGNGTPPSVFRQMSSSSSPAGPTLPTPFLAFAITAIALFVLVVAFVLLRIIVRNRRLRRLGLLPDGPIDRILGQAREVEDTLAPPKLWEAKIAHDYMPQRTDPEAKLRGWDAVMPVSAALPPSVYSDLFPNDTASTKDGEKNKGGNGSGANGSTYPPTSQVRSNMVSRHMHLPGFLRRGGGGAAGTGGALEAASAGNDSPNGATAGVAGVTGSSSGDDADATTTPVGDDALPASVNVTVLIAMPSPRTVFPAAQLGRKGSSTGVGSGGRQQPAPPPTTTAAASAGSSGFSPLTRVRSTRLDEVLHEHHEGDEDEEHGIASTDAQASRLQRKASAKSFRTVGSTKSLAEARREAFFGAMADEHEKDNQQQGSTQAAAAAASSAAAAAPPTATTAPFLGASAGDDEDEELPELVFGTASVPIFRKASSTSASATTPAAARKTFGDHADRHQPIRRELLELVAAAHEARERKTRNDTAAKEAEASKGSEDAHSNVDHAPARTSSSSRLGQAQPQPQAQPPVQAAPSTTATTAQPNSSTSGLGLGAIRTSAPSPDIGAPPLGASARPSVSSSTLDPPTPRVEQHARTSTTTLDPLLR